jgi:N-acetylmuramoyl-L-alanine amidase
MAANTPSRERARRRARRLRRSAVWLAVVAVTAAVAVVWRPTWLVSAIGGSGSNGTPLDPSAFADGSCVAFDPTSGDRGVTVFLDAGHGGLDPGGVGTTETGASIDESTSNLAVELDASALLRAQGFRVVVSRTTDSTVVRLTPADVSGSLLSLQGAHDDVAARDQCANDAGAAALVGIYEDAGPASAAGALTAYDASRSFAAANLRLARLVQHDVLGAMNAKGWAIPDDGVQSDGGLGSNSGNPADGGLAAQAAAYDHLMLLGPADPGFFDVPSAMPGVVTEPLYLTDPFEGSIAASSSGQQTIAQGVAAAVEAFFAPSAGSNSTGG